MRRPSSLNSESWGVGGRGRQCNMREVGARKGCKARSLVAFKCAACPQAPVAQMAELPPQGLAA